MTSRNPAKDKVAIAGVGLSPYARDRGATTELAMVLEAAVAAIRDAGLTAADIDGVVGGGLLTGGIDPATVASALGLPAVTWWARAAPPIMNHLVAAVNAVWTGACDVALVYHSVYRVGGFSRSADADPFRRRAAFGLPDGRAATGDGHTRRRAVEPARLGRLRRLGGPLPGGVRRVPGGFRPHRDQRPEQRGGQPERGAAGAADHGRLPGRPDGPRAAVPVRHGHPGRRGRRVHRDHRRAGPRHARRPGPRPRGHHGHDHAT